LNEGAQDIRKKQNGRVEALQRIVKDLEMEKEEPALRALIDGSMSGNEISKVLEAGKQEHAERAVLSIAARGRSLHCSLNPHRRRGL